MNASVYVSKCYSPQDLTTDVCCPSHHRAAVWPCTAVPLILKCIFIHVIYFFI
uniref:Uncharacterized protein n=1 Tax=Anguilla anguilla TaxID=7936 RepID=A0A0E9P6C3_ANGAN